MKARFHPAQSGCFQRLCIGSLKVSARENLVLLRRFAPLLCVSIGMSGVWFTPRSAFLLGCLAFGSRPALRFYWDVWRLVHACCLPHSAKQDGLRYVAFLFRRGSGSPVLRSRIVSAIIGLCRFTLSLRVSLWRSRRRTKGRGERSRRRGVGAFCASILAL